MRLLIALKHIGDLEKKVSELYGKFSELFLDDYEASRFFDNMSKDELSHGDMVAFQIRLVNKNPVLFEDVDIDMNEIATLVSRINEILKSELKPALEEAINIALEIENNASEFHYRKAITISNPDMAKLLKGLGKSDEEHRDQIANFANKRGIIYILEETL